MMEEDDDNGILFRNAWHVVPHVVPLRLPVGALPSGVRTRDNDDDDNEDEVRRHTNVAV